MYRKVQDIHMLPVNKKSGEEENVWIEREDSVENSQRNVSPISVCQSKQPLVHYKFNYTFRPFLAIIM